MKVRTTRKGGFTSVSNDIFKAGMSARAIGLLALMLSKPPGWHFSVARLASEVREGEDAIYTTMQELEKVGFVVRQREHVSNAPPQVIHHIRDSLEAPWPWANSAVSRTGSARTGKCGVLVSTEREKTDLVKPLSAGGRVTQQKRAGMPTYGEDLDKPRTVAPKGGIKQEFALGESTDDQPVPRRVHQFCVQVEKHMEGLWPHVLLDNVDYRGSKVIDRGAFRRYLNTNFFGPGAMTPMTLPEVLSIVDRFMEDLRRREFALKPGQPVWVAFTRRWQNYSSNVGQVGVPSAKYRAVTMKEVFG